MRHQVYFIFVWERVQFFISLPPVLLVTLRFRASLSNLKKRLREVMFGRAHAVDHIRHRLQQWRKKLRLNILRYLHQLFHALLRDLVWIIDPDLTQSLCQHLFERTGRDLVAFAVMITK